MGERFSRSTLTPSTASIATKVNILARTKLGLVLVPRTLALGRDCSKSEDSLSVGMNYTLFQKGFKAGHGVPTLGRQRQEEQVQILCGLYETLITYTYVHVLTPHTKMIPKTNELKFENAAEL